MATSTTKSKSKTASSRTAQQTVRGSGINRWSSDEDSKLKTLIRQNTPTRLIAMKLKRTEGSVRQHVSKLGISLRPTNRSPYG